MLTNVVQMIGGCPVCAELLYADDADGNWIFCDDCERDVDVCCVAWRRSDSYFDVQP